ncbi:MAG: hypothetical protein ACRDRO_16510, partial [Pseudonocardiaceae bacterium]
DSRVGAAFMRVSNLLDPPPRLLSPTLMLRVLRANLRRRRDFPMAGALGLRGLEHEATTSTRAVSGGGQT